MLFSPEESNSMRQRKKTGKKAKCKKRERKTAMHIGDLISFGGI
jgi:hypothetical protein